MRDNKVHFKQSLKKQIWTITSVIGIIVIFPIITGGLKTDLEFYTWILLTLGSSYIVFIMLKKQSKEALYPYCKSDLFEVIEVSNSVKLNFNFCPSCGKKIEL